MNWKMRNIFAIKCELALRARSDADDHIKGGSFPGAIRAQQSYNFSSCYLNGDVIDDSF